MVALSLKLLAQALSISRLYIFGGSWAENAVLRKKWEERGIGRYRDEDFPRRPNRKVGEEALGTCDLVAL